MLTLPMFGLVGYAAYHERLFTLETSIKYMVLSASATPLLFGMAALRQAGA